MRTDLPRTGHPDGPAPAVHADRSLAGSPRAPDGGRPRRIFFVVNVDWFFLSHRLPLARAARDAGMEVTIVAADTGQTEEIRREGFRFIPFSFSRQGTRLADEVRAIADLTRLYRRERPDLVHHVTIKPVLYGSLAARLCRDTRVVNAISGLGYVFTDQNRAGGLRRVVQGAYRVALGRPHSRTIFQNPDDLRQFVRSGLIAPERAVLIRGSGVDCQAFRASPEPPGTPVVVLPARLLWDKGIQAFVDAAERLQRREVAARFVLVGSPDEGNPATVSLRTVEDWVARGVVEWWGHRQDMAEVYAQASLVVLPSRREGLPKVLLEAAASGRAMVATDVPGCREVVRPGVTGTLVPPDDGSALADAIHELLASPGRRRQYAEAARRMAVEEFSEEIVAGQTMQLYRELLGEGARAEQHVAS